MFAVKLRAMSREGTSTSCLGKFMQISSFASTYKAYIEPSMVILIINLLSSYEMPYPR